MTTDTQTEPTDTGPRNTPANVLLYGSQDEIREMARRLRQFLPNTKKMSDNEVLGFAQYCIATGLNPFRSEVHGWDFKGELVTHEHYKLVVRWAKSQGGFTTRYEPILTGIGEGDIAYRCHLLRDQDRPLLAQLLAAGRPFEDAMAWAESVGEGILTAGELAKAREAHKSPPKGKTWDWVCRKRALVDAIAQAYGMPSGQELSAQSWIVNGHKTIPADYENANGNMLPAEIEAEAEYSARERKRLADPTPPGNGNDAKDDLFGDW